VAAVRPAAQIDGCQYFDVTQHNLCEPFSAYWNAHGGLANFGYPLTDAVEENGVMVQYFERTRVEYQPGAWPDRMDVLLGRLGAEAIDRALAH
jgi:hypothetical protein